MRTTIGLSVIAAMVGVAMLATNAWATPDYAAKTGQPCTTCHSAVPALNATGEAYRADGYVWPIPTAPSAAPAAPSPAPTQQTTPPPAAPSKPAGVSLKSIEVKTASGGPFTLSDMGSLALKAIGTYSDGSTEDLTTLATWDPIVQPKAAPGGAFDTSAAEQGYVALFYGPNFSVDRTGTTDANGNPFPNPQLRTFHSQPGVLFPAQPGYVDVKASFQGVTAKPVRVTVTPGPSGDTARGKATYQTDCASCHALGAVTPEGAADQTPWTQDLDGWYPGAVATSIRAAVDHGGTAIETTRHGPPMPAFNNLSDQDVADLVAYMTTPPGATLTSVDVAPAEGQSLSMTEDGSLQLKATAHFSDGSSADVTGFATWSPMVQPKPAPGGAFDPKAAVDLGYVALAYGPPLSIDRTGSVDDNSKPFPDPQRRTFQVFPGRFFPVQVGSAQVTASYEGITSKPVTISVTPGLKAQPFAGPVTYAQNCLSCHGRDTVDLKAAPGNSWVQDIDGWATGAVATSIRAAVDHGGTAIATSQGGPPMPTFDKLSDQQVANLIDYLRWPPARVSLTATRDGNTVTYSATVQNIGVSDLTGIELRNTLPAGLTFAGADPAGGVTPTWTGSTVKWDLSGPLASDASAGPFVWRVTASGAPPANVAQVAYTYSGATGDAVSDAVSPK